MIPKLIHHIWLGPRPAPPAGAWGKLNPSWELKLWREADIRALPMKCRKQYQQLLEAECWHGAADVARLEILRIHGGLYVDIDSTPLAPLDGAPFLGADVFAAYEPVPSLPGRVANGTIGAKPAAEPIITALSLIQRMRILDPPWATVGAPALTAALLVHQQCCAVKVLPARTFYPTNAHGRPVKGREQPYCEHQWATTNQTYAPISKVLVPRRAGDPVRDRAWAFVKSWWESHGWEVVEGHHGPDEGLFSAAAARNRAAALAGDAGVFIFADGDTIPGDADVIREAVTKAHTTGHFTRPYRRYWQLGQEASEQWMETGDRPSKGAKLLGEQAHGGVVIVPKQLYEKVHGYDERFVGWGWEDTAFEMACRSMGGFTQLGGDVYHLWHSISTDRDTSSPQYQANVKLGHQYLNANRRTMRQLVEHKDPGPLGRDRYGLLLITNGRRELIPQTMAAAEANLSHIDHLMICDDSGDPSMALWLQREYPRAQLDAHRHLGHGPAVNRALRMATEAPVEWVVVLEEDMVFLEPIDLVETARIISSQKLAQMVWKRGPHFPDEVAAGGMIERFDPKLFTDEETDGQQWLRHRVFYSLNPHLVSRRFLRKHKWPPRPNSEHHFSRKLFRDPGVSVGLWGARDSAPVVEHSGTERTGSGY